MASLSDMKQIFTFIIIILGLIACQAPKALNSALNREWMLVEFSGFNKQQLIDKRAKITINTDEKGRVYFASARMGCNMLNYQLSPSSSENLTITNFTTTEMACDNMQLENDFIKDFKGSITYKIEGHFLTLITAEGKTFKFIAADWD